MDGNGAEEEMIKAIIFDCFGVLAEDGWLPIKRKYIGNNKELAQQIADLGKKNEFGMLNNDELEKRMAGLMNIDASELKAALGKRVPNEELFDLIDRELKPHYKIGLMSNANFNVLTDLFTEEQAKVFDASVMSYESRLIKPDKKMFELIAGRIGAPMAECLFVDDVERYCAAAEEYGMEALVYESYEDFIDKLPRKLSGMIPPR